MPIKFSDNHICEKCGKIFEWNYFESVRTRIDSPYFVVEKMPTDKTLVHSFEKSDDGYMVAVNCPYCDFYNRFVFTD